MVAFFLTCAVLVVVVLGYVLEPLRQPGQLVGTRTHADANLVVYRRQLAEMKAELAGGLITSEQFARERQDLEERLMKEFPLYGRPAAKPSSHPRNDPAVYLLAVSIPVAAIVIYLALGAS